MGSQQRRGAPAYREGQIKREDPLPKLLARASRLAHASYSSPFPPSRVIIFFLYLIYTYSLIYEIQAHLHEQSVSFDDLAPQVAADGSEHAKHGKRCNA